MDKQRLKEVGQRMEKLQELLGSDLVIDEANEIGKSDDLRGLLATIILSLGFQEMDTAKVTEIAFSFGWALGRLEQRGEKKVVDMTTNFPNEKEVIELTNQELQQAVDTHMEGLGKEKVNWRDLVEEEER